MNMATFKSEYLKEEDTVTVSARELQNLLIKYDSLERKVDSVLNKNKRLAIYIEDLELQIEKLQNTHITLDLKV